MALQAETVENIVHRQRELDAVLNSFTTIASYEALQVELDRAAKVPAEKRVDSDDVGRDLHAFSKTVEALLREWRWLSEHAEVAFDRREWDIVIDGKARRSNGKGVRALTHAAFVLAILRHCRERRLPHPGFVVLDSPLTTYRERKGASGTAAEVHDAFFSSVARTFATDQVIVLENKEPSDAVKPLLHFIEFAGSPEFGRLGFYDSGTAAILESDEDAE